MYAGTVIYEIHVRAQRQWRTVATSNDPNAAVAQAVQLRGSRRYAGIRVTEAFHDAADKSTARAIYRYTAAEPSAAALDAPSQDRSATTEPSSPDSSPARPKAALKAWSVGRFLPHLSIALAALLVLMTFSAA